jgi:hypothetical protein
LRRHQKQWQAIIHSADTFQLSAAEMSAIAASFNDKSETKAVIANGIKVNGDKYMTIESTDDSLKAKKVRMHYPMRLAVDRRLTQTTGQGRRRRLQDHTSAPYRPPPRLRTNAQRFQLGRRAGRVPQEGWLLEPMAGWDRCVCTLWICITSRRGSDGRHSLVGSLRFSGCG